MLKKRLSLVKHRMIARPRDVSIDSVNQKPLGTILEEEPIVLRWRKQHVLKSPTGIWLLILYRFSNKSQPCRAWTLTFAVPMQRTPEGAHSAAEETTTLARCSFLVLPLLSASSENTSDKSQLMGLAHSATHRSAKLPSRFTSNKEENNSQYGPCLLASFQTCGATCICKMLLERTEKIKLPPKATLPTLAPLETFRKKYHQSLKAEKYNDSSHKYKCSIGNVGKMARTIVTCETNLATSWPVHPFFKKKGACWSQNATHHEDESKLACVVETALGCLTHMARYVLCELCPQC